MSRSLRIGLAFLVLCPLPLIHAQDEEVSLGDVARAARIARTSKDQSVIDNDNLDGMMDQAESERLNGKPVFSIDPSGKTFRMTSPDGTCSLSFDAHATALISTPFVASPLPQDELLKLDGPATIHDGVIEVSLHNGSEWELKEVVIGITVLQSFPSGPPNSSPAEPAKKRPDVTVLYHLKGSSMPGSDAIFQGALDADLDAGKDWHWSLVSARGIPPAAPASVSPQVATAMANGSQPETRDTQPPAQPSASSLEPYPSASSLNGSSAPAPVNAPPPGLSARH